MPRKKPNARLMNGWTGIKDFHDAFRASKIRFGKRPCAGDPAQGLFCEVQTGIVEYNLLSICTLLQAQWNLECSTGLYLEFFRDCEEANR